MRYKYQKSRLQRLCSSYFCEVAHSLHCTQIETFVLHKVILRERRHLANKRIMLTLLSYSIPTSKNISRTSLFATQIDRYKEKAKFVLLSHNRKKKFETYVHTFYTDYVARDSINPIM